jgi:hypothetical protein
MLNIKKEKLVFLLLVALLFLVTMLYTDGIANVYPYIVTVEFAGYVKSSIGIIRP